MDKHMKELRDLLGTDVLATYYHLVRAGKQLRLYELSELSGIPKPTVSRNLQRLYAAGWVEKDGYKYRAVKDVLYKAFRDEQAVLVRDSIAAGNDMTAELLEAILRDAEAGRLDLPRYVLVRLHAALERILSEG
ncbi:MAG: helix-turn-helix domain-containing protein [Candidatus Diapherotrites archaeon]|nr:helix-turn-helix domain-containing protein [Candidatus Diapherotrites archaeon]